MEQYSKKNREGMKKNKKNKFPQNNILKTKAKKKGRPQQSAISGFSTLSQVSGSPVWTPYHSSIPVSNTKNVVEPNNKCVICGETINSIAEAFFYGGGYAHFDCILNLLKNNEVLSEGDSISYIGSGQFGICHKNEDGKYTIVKRIEIENKESNVAFKDYVESLKK